MASSAITTLQVGRLTKKALDRLKKHPRESYNDLLARMAAHYSPADKESLVETIEVLSDPELMRAIAKGMEDYETGKSKTLTQTRKELGL